ncbi:T9SS type A sorting domain-containing protein [Aureivirga marina]|uniref:T9SS type A sorting domain-containing protein n=1 Tax=Aureivirga marina TaxID=1182451 RepID=UPI0018CBD498|nr:T9SS type A sorting domain-containing protein [Aureivirga marina]
MRKTLLFVSFILTSLNFFAQDCPDSDVTLTTQAEVDAFKTNYPDCTDFPNTLTVGDIDNEDSTIENLNGLSNLISVQGSFWIINNPLLSTLGEINQEFGLNNLAVVEGDLIIENNDLLTNVSGLENLVSVGQNFAIRKNTEIADLYGLNKIATVDEEFEITENPKLETFEGIVETLTVNDFTVGNNLLLEDFSGFINDIIIEGNIQISSNPSLASLMGPDDSSVINYQGENFVLVSNNALNDLSGLELVTEINGDLYLQGNMNLLTYNGLANLTTIDGNLVIVFNPSVTNFVGFSGLQTITGDFLVASNEKLINFQGIPMLTTVNGVISISFNDTLGSLAGFENLQTAENGITITENGVLNNCTGICNILLSGAIDGKLFLQNNNEDCSSASDLKTQCEDLDIEDLEEDFNLKIFPNPTENYLTILDSKLKNVQIFDLQGKKVVNSNENFLNVSHLETGIYVLKVISDKVYTERLIIK